MEHMSIAHIFKYIWNYPPRDVLSSLLRRIFKNTTWDYSMEKVVNSKKHMNVQYLIDRWERYWRVIENRNRDCSRLLFNFEGKTVLELGCGPLFGWGPMALNLGANAYYYHDPFLNRATVESEEIREKYFFPFWRELEANFGSNGMDFSVFYQAMIKRCSEIDFHKQNENVDLILSNSVLEHIPRHDVAHISSKLFSILKPGGHFLHCVDFGSHGFGGEGFGKLYHANSDEELHNLNLLRMSDIESILVNSGFELAHATVYHSVAIDRSKVNKSWGHYSDEALGAQVVLFVGSKPRH